jgi:hypothetical protein
MIKINLIKPKHRFFDKTMDVDEEEIKFQPKSIQLLWETYRDALNEFYNRTGR